MPTSLNITEVARETGLGKDSLRAWERRYGFPTPHRNQQGERFYTQDQVDRLRTIQRLLLAGFRPGKVVSLAPEALQDLLARSSPEWAQAGGTSESPTLDIALALLRAGDTGGLRRLLSQSVARLGLASFVAHLVAPLADRIGQAWMDGRLQVYEEHLGIELLHGALRHAMQGLPEAPASAAPRVLLTTFPGENHGLGLLMAEAMMTLEGCRCINLGVQTPIADMAEATRRYDIDIVGLSVAGGLPARRLSNAVIQLRARLPEKVVIWLGGHGACYNRSTSPGLEVLGDLHAIAAAVSHWRAVTKPT